MSTAKTPSPDGKYLYYTKTNQQGIWRIPVAGGEETSVINDFESEIDAAVQALQEMFLRNLIF